MRDQKQRHCLKGRDVNRNVVKTAKKKRKKFCARFIMQSKSKCVSKGKEAKKSGVCKDNSLWNCLSQEVVEVKHFCIGGILYVWRHCEVAPRTPQLPGAPEKIQIQFGTLLWDSCQRRSTVFDMVRWTVHPNLLWHFTQNDISKSF